MIHTRLESIEHPAEAVSHNIQAKDRGVVAGVLLRVARQFECDGPWPQDGYECEAPLAEVVGGRAFAAGSSRIRSDCMYGLVGCKIE